MPTDCAATPMRPRLEIGERDLESFALVAEHLVGADRAVLERDLAMVGTALAHRVLDPHDRGRPGVSVGTTKAERPFLPALGSVTAKTIARSALSPEVMNCCCPLSTKRLP